MLNKCSSIFPLCLSFYISCRTSVSSSFTPLISVVRLVLQEVTAANICLSVGSGSWVSGAGNSIPGKGGVLTVSHMQASAGSSGHAGLLSSPAGRSKAGSTGRGIDWAVSSAEFFANNYCAAYLAEWGTQLPSWATWSGHMGLSMPLLDMLRRRNRRRCVKGSVVPEQQVKSRIEEEEGSYSGFSEEQIFNISYSKCRKPLPLFQIFIRQSLANWVVQWKLNTGGGGLIFNFELNLHMVSYRAHLQWTMQTVGYFLSGEKVEAPWVLLSGKKKIHG